MAVNLVSPGVNIREVDLTIGRADQTNEQVGAIAGPFEKGPINSPILISSESELIKIFGKPKINDDQYEYWLSASNYLSYGGQLRVIRVGDQNSATGRLTNANVGVETPFEDLRIFNQDDYDNNHRDALSWNYAAKNPGSWANGLKICVIDNFADQIISGISTAGIQVGFAVTQYATGNEIVGSEIQTINGHIRGLITGIGNNEIYVKVQDLFQPNLTVIFDENNEVIGVEQNPTIVPISYVKTPPGGPQVSPFTFNTIGSSEESDGRFHISNNVGTAITTISSDPTEGVQILDWYDNQTLGLTNSKVFWKAIAPKPGTSQYALERNCKDDEIHVVLVDESGSISGISNNIIEKFNSLSKATDGRISPSRNTYYKEFIESVSEFLYIGAHQTGVTGSLIASGITSAYTLVSTPWGSLTQDSRFNVLGAKIYSLDGGGDYSGNAFINGFDSDTSEVISGYQLLTNPAEYSINYLINGPSGGNSEFEAQAKANALIAIAEERKDCVAVISPYKDGVLSTTNPTRQTDNIIRFFSTLSSSSYTVFDSGYKYTFDRFNNRFFHIACNSDVAGIMARTSLRNQPWFSPAGSVRGTLNNVIKLAYNPSKTQRDELYTSRINPIIANGSFGFILFGDKTALSYPSAFDRINVRKLFLTLERTIESAARSQLFEFNDSITRTNFINIVEPYLRDVRAKRGITEFVVVCDETNNTPDVIDSNQFKADIFIKPARSINFIGLTFVATRTGVSFSEVVGTV
jgi:hypothetical protein